MAEQTDIVDEQDPPKKGGGPLLMLVPVLTAALGAALAYFMLDQFVQPSEANAAAATEQAEAAPEPDPGEYGEFHMLPGLIVNPSGSDGRRYLMVDIGFEAADGGALEELAEKEVVVRDLAVRLLSERTIETLADIGQRDSLKAALLGATNGVLEKPVDRVYFAQYVLQ